jgi:hypothetical protein
MEQITQVCLGSEAKVRLGQASDRLNKGMMIDRITILNISENRIGESFLHSDCTPNGRSDTQSDPFHLLGKLGDFSFSVLTVTALLLRREMFGMF